MPGFSGVHTALVTPFLENGDLDLPTYEKLIQRQLNAGIHGLVPCGTTGETPTLEQDEWEILVKTAVELGKGKATVTAGVGTNNTRSTLKNIERAATLGVDAGLLVLPYYNKPTPAGLKAHVQAAASVGLPLVIYHVPGRTGQRVDAKLLAELCSIPGVVACKEATGDIQYGQDFQLGLSRRVALLSGDDFTWMPLLSVGGDGVISVLSNVAPVLTVGVYDAWVRGDVGGSFEVHRRLYPVVHFLFAQANPIPVKAMLAAMGLCGGGLRLPLVPGNTPALALLEGLR